ncbi:MAG TPA: M50 family metallopeptidase [Patescibacteria group bacterium]|nr:M50 family metallopeptidase [Patescibacteria group bacterium]
MLFNIVVFILILSVLVIIHEMGHFIAARFFKMNVEEFGIGYPPKILTLFKWKGIPFTLNAIPFGGFVKLDGEIPDDENAKRTEGQFWPRPGWQRLIVLCAGVLCNFIFGVLAFTILYSKYGIPVAPPPTVAIISPGSPAETAGLKVGDTFNAVGSTPVTSIDQFKNIITANQGNNVDIFVLRDGKTEKVTAHIRTEKDRPSDQGLLGVAFPEPTVKFYPWYEMPFRAGYTGTKQALLFGKMVVTSLADVGRQAVVDKKVTTQLSGPIGIVYEADKQKLFADGFFGDLNFAALLSINLAVINILPLPALDGGRVFLLLFERFLNHKRRAKLENIINTIGFALIISLIVVISFSDIAHILQSK